MSWEDEDCPYLFMMGRRCCSKMMINPSTLPKVLHSVKKEFPEEKIHYFQGGCYMKTQSAHILIEPVSSYRGLQVKLGIRKDRVGNSKEEVKSIIKNGIKLFEKAFTKVGCTSMEESNPSFPLERWVLSLEGMLEKDNNAYYKLADVQKHFEDGKRFINSDTKRSDTTALLLTWMEMSNEEQKIVVSLKTSDKFYLLFEQVWSRTLMYLFKFIQSCNIRIF